jgi:hypothetical protein
MHDTSRAMAACDFHVSQCADIALGARDVNKGYEGLKYV